jgi:peroxiredoxin
MAVLVALAGSAFASGPVHAQTEDAGPQAQAVAAGRGLIGSTAPRLTLQTVDGQPIDLGALYGKKAVYLKFWATWCVPCRRQMPHFEGVWQGAGDDLAVIGVNVGLNDSRDAVLRYRDELGISMPLVMDDGTLAQALSLRVTPQHVVIGRDARIRYVGHLADEQLDAALRSARAPDAATTAVAARPERRAGAAGTRSSGSAPAIGDRLPDLTLETLTGDSFAARSSAGSGTALVFFTPWCESYWKTSRPAMSEACQRVREQVESLRRGHGDVRWLGIASTIWTTPAALGDYERDHGTTLPLALDADGRWFRAFGVMSVPTIVLADANGRIVGRIEGYDERFAVQLAALAAGDESRR